MFIESVLQDALVFLCGTKLAHARTTEPTFLGTSDPEVPGRPRERQEVDGLSDVALSLLGDIISFCTLGCWRCKTDLSA